MPRIPSGSWPPGRLTRNVVLADFDSPHSFPAAGGILASGAQVESPIWDVLTPLYRGRGSSTGAIAETQGWTRGLGTPGAVTGAAREQRVGAVFLDAAIWATQQCSVRFDWIFFYSAGVPVVGASYLWLPVMGSPAPSYDLVPVVQMVQGLRVPSPWFRWVFTNEAAVDLSLETDAFFFVWLRGA